MTDHMPLSRYTADYAGQDPLRLAVAAAVDAFAKASIEISDLIGCGALAGITGEAQGAQNADGDVQKDLDVRADEIVRAALKPVSWAALASEEAETADIRDGGGLLDIAYDPLDGSSNIETNMTVGHDLLDHADVEGRCAVHAKRQRADRCRLRRLWSADIAGPHARRRRRNLHARSRRWELQAHSRSACRSRPSARNMRSTRPTIATGKHRCATSSKSVLAGVDGPRGKNFNMRWIAALVAEAYRILIRGGVFLYPSDARKGYADGRLRLVYEAHPMAFIVEQAGGGATTGRARILDLAPTAIHQRVPLIMGSISKVRRIEAMHLDASAGQAQAAAE